MTSQSFLLCAALAVLAGAATPQFHYDSRAEGWLAASGQFDMTAAVQRFSTDQQTLLSYYDTRLSPERGEAMRLFDQTWLDLLDTVPFDALTVDGRIDWILLRGRAREDLHRQQEAARRHDEAAALVPFAGLILNLDNDLR